MTEPLALPFADNREDLSTYSWLHADLAAFPFSDEEIRDLEAIASQISKPTVDKVVPFVKRLYYTYAMGGYFHIVFDDGNTDDCFIEWCANQAAYNGDRFSVALGLVLRRMSLTQRNKLYRSHR
jgi:hypothetical protein